MKVRIGKYKENRKVEVVIDDYDTWSLDSTLAKVIYPALVAFKEQRKKMPGVAFDFFSEEAQKDKTGNYTDEAFEEAEKNFTKIIDKMIWSFREIAEDNPGESQFFLKNGKKWKTKKLKKGNKHIGSELVETGMTLDKEGYTEYHNRIKEGVELFGKYYQTLWW